MSSESKNLTQQQPSENNKERKDVDDDSSSVSSEELVAPETTITTTNEKAVAAVKNNEEFLRELVGDEDETSLMAKSAPPSFEAGEDEEQVQNIAALDKFSSSTSPTAAAAAAASTTTTEEQKQDFETEQQQQQQQQHKWEEFGTLKSEQIKDQQAQHFEYFLLIDFECTCDETPGYHNEVIEIPALLFDTRSLEVVDEFHTYVRPLRNPTLTPFCLQLTGIKQHQVDSAPCYDEALEMLQGWLHKALVKQKQLKIAEKKAGTTASATATTTKTTTSSSSSSSINVKTDGAHLCVMTDGACDLELFGYLFMHKRDGFAFPSVFHRYIDVKEAFRDDFGEGRYFKIKDMVSHFGMRFAGHEHSGIDDTRNLARVVACMIRNGTVFDRIYHVTHYSGKSRVVSHLWNRGKFSVKRATTSKTTGNGPNLAKRVRKGEKLNDDEDSLLPGVKSRGDGKLSVASLFFGSSSKSSSSSFLWKFFFTRIVIRNGEFAVAPSTPFLVLLLCVFIATFFVSVSTTSK